MYRIVGGLVILQKCQCVNGSKIPIPHDKTADSTVPRFGLSVKQQEFVIKHKGDNSDEWLVKEMTKKGCCVKCSEAQRSDIPKFVKSVENFHSRNAKYFASKNDIKSELQENVQLPFSFNSHSPSKRTNVYANLD